MLPSILKYLYSAEPVRMHFPTKQPCTNDTMCNAAMQHCTQYHLYTAVMLLCSIVPSIICTRLFRGKMHSDWFSGTEMFQGRW